MTKTDPRIIKERVQSRLRDLDMSVAEATRRGKLPKDYIYDLLNDRKRTLRTDKLAALARALDCDYAYLSGDQLETSVVNNYVDFDRPPISIVGEAATGVYVRKHYVYNTLLNAPDMPTLPPDTRYDPQSQVDLYVRGNSINRFAPSGYILRCVLINDWNDYVRDGDLVIVDRFKEDLRERAAWRIRPTSEYAEYSTDSDDKSEFITWRAPIGSEGTADGQHRPYAMVLFAYAMPRIRRMF